MKYLVSLILMIGLFSPAWADSDTIYKWTDAQGVLRFSSNPPPGNVQNYEKIESQTPASESPGPEERRSSFDRMVEQSSHEALQLEQQRKAEAAARAAEAKRKADARRNEKTAAERRRLEQEIQAIKNRAVSPTYSPGMKKSQIDKLKEEIERLEKNPDAVEPREPGPSPPSKSDY